MDTRMVCRVAALALFLHSVAANAQLSSAPEPPFVRPDKPDLPAEIAADANADLSATGYYNKPGATRATYYDDWENCRLIARGAQMPQVYTGGILGAVIGSAIVDSKQKRANRHACLLIKGWRFVTPPDELSHRLQAMSTDQRIHVIDGLIGAAKVDGEISEAKSFSVDPDPALPVYAPLTTPGIVSLPPKLAPGKPLTLEGGQGALLVGFRRPDHVSAGRSVYLQLRRYDVAQGDVVAVPKNAKKIGDLTTYTVPVSSTDRNAAYEVEVVPLTAGDYVVAQEAPNSSVTISTNCFGAPIVHVAAGQIAYFGDLVPFVNARRADGTKTTGLAYTAHPEEAKAALANAQPALAEQFAPAAVRDQATYSCDAIAVNRWDIPGAEHVPARASDHPVDAAPPATPATAAPIS